MDSRRDFMNYVGTGAVGGMVGYYVGAKELLGIQSVSTQQMTSPEETEPGEGEEGGTTESEGLDAGETGENALFRDDFTDGTFEDRWSFAEGERNDDTEITETGTTLRHDSPANYGPNEPILTDRSFETEGAHRITMRARTNESDYNGWGISIRGEEAGVSLKNHKWEGFDRLAVFGVTDRPNEYASDYDAYGEQSNKAKLAPATSRTSFLTYSITLDFEADTVTGARRGEQTWDLSLQMRNLGDSYRLQIPAGGGHDVEYDVVSVRPVNDS